MALSIHVYAVVLNTGGASIFDQKMQFLMILKISDFCQKFEFWVFWGVIGHSGSLEMSIFLVFGRSQNFDFFGFFGRSENFGGRLWRCACGCQYPTHPTM